MARKGSIDGQISRGSVALIGWERKEGARLEEQMGDRVRVRDFVCPQGDESVGEGGVTTTHVRS